MGPQRLAQLEPAQTSHTDRLLPGSVTSDNDQLMYRQAQRTGEKPQKFAVRPEILGWSRDLDSQRTIPETHDFVRPSARLNTDSETHESPFFMDLQHQASGVRGPKIAEPIRSRVAPSSIATA